MKAKGPEEGELLFPWRLPRGESTAEILLAPGGFMDTKKGHDT